MKKGTGCMVVFLIALILGLLLSIITLDVIASAAFSVLIIVCICVIYNSRSRL